MMCAGWDQRGWGIVQESLGVLENMSLEHRCRSKGCIEEFAVATVRSRLYA